MMVGIPASGKSTYAKKISKETGAVLLSSDSLREELTGDAGDVATVPHKEIFRILQKRAEELIKKDQDIIWDATNINSFFRRRDINKWKGKGIKIIGVYCSIPKEDAINRNKNRERMVPEEVIERMHKNLFEGPIDTEKDFFDEVRVVGPEGEIVDEYKRNETKHNRIFGSEMSKIK